MSCVAAMRHMTGFFRDVLLWCIMAAQVHVFAVLACILSASEPLRHGSAYKLICLCIRMPAGL